MEVLSSPRKMGIALESQLQLYIIEIVTVGTRIMTNFS